MSWAVVAVAGTVVSAYGTYQATEQAKKDREMMSDAMDAQNQIARERLTWEKGQYEEQKARWMDVYGDIEEDLSAFYEGLSEEDMVATGLNEQRVAYKQTQQRLQRSVAQRNIDSPATEMMEQSLALSEAEGRAQTRFQAPLALAGAKQGFLAGGKGGMPSTAGVSNAYGASQAGYGGQANMYSKQYAQSQKNVAAGYAATGKAMGTGAYLYGRYGGQQPDSTQQSNLQDYSNYNNPNFAGRDYALYSREQRED